MSDVEFTGHSWENEPVSGFKDAHLLDFIWRMQRDRYVEGKQGPGPNDSVVYRLPPGGRLELERLTRALTTKPST